MLSEKESTSSCLSVSVNKGKHYGGDEMSFLTDQ